MICDQINDKLKSKRIVMKQKIKLKGSARLKKLTALIVAEDRVAEVARQKRIRSRIDSTWPNLLSITDLLSEEGFIDEYYAGDIMEVVINDLTNQKAYTTISFNSFSKEIKIIWSKVSDGSETNRLVDYSAAISRLRRAVENDGRTV